MLDQEEQQWWYREGFKRGFETAKFEAKIAIISKGKECIENYLREAEYYLPEEKKDDQANIDGIVQQDQE